MAKHRNRRIPKLRFTRLRDIGWHVNYRDQASGIPRKHRFNITEKDREPEARVLYAAWVAEHLGGVVLPAKETKVKPAPKRAASSKMLSGCILEIASGFIEAERLRSREAHEPRRRGSIAAPVFRDRKKVVQDFLEFLNATRGVGAVARMRLSDLTMEDVEAFNRGVVEKGYSASQVAKRLQIVKAIIDRAGRPEYGGQVLKWNWDSRDVSHGKPTNERTIPTRKQLLQMLRGTDLRGRTMIWLGIGLGFGARDLAAIRVGQITRDAYDLRRSKTGVQRFGETPARVWHYVSKYQTKMKRPAGQLLFVTKHGVPLVQPTSNAVTQWWDKLRTRIGESKATLPGFYTLRHLGATEFGSRPGCSIGDIKRWLGHSASSDMADVYMRPVRPEFEEVIEWVRSRLQTPTIDDEPGVIKLRQRKNAAKKEREAL